MMPADAGEMAEPVAGTEAPAGADGSTDGATLVDAAARAASVEPDLGAAAAPPADGGDQGPAGDAEAAEEDPAVAPHALFRVMDLMDVQLDLPAAYPMVTLQEAEAPLRTLQFPVGLTEGTWLAHALRQIGTPRPLTHELFASVLGRFHIDLVAVRLIGRTGGNYLAELDLIGVKGREIVPCRPTDALTLALRMPVPAPLLCDVRLLEQAGDVEPI